jgi:LacI family transcriptional regulator
MHTILRFPRASENRSKDSILSALNDRYGISLKVADVNVSAAEEVAELLSFWHPDGCVVNNDKLPTEWFADYPTVFHHRRLAVDNPIHATVSFDEKSVAETAAHHLLSLDLASYVYIPPRTDELWSRERERHFVHILGLNGYGLASYVHPKNRLSAPKRLARLANWLANLPRPVGVFAANDSVAADVIAACDHRHLNVPEDVAVLGVDNDEAVCEALRPTLSSIATDIISMRNESFRLLEQIISGKLSANRHVTLKPLGVVRRASTLRIQKSDPTVFAACELIRQKACEGLKARDVAATFPCGRRMAEIRFRAAIGHSILDEIRSVRRARAKMAMFPFRTQLRDEVAALCGYSSWSSVHRLLSR